MIRTTRTLIDADYYDDVEATLNNHGQLILYNTDTRNELNLSASQTSALRDLLNEHFADASDGERESGEMRTIVYPITLDPECDPTGEHVEAESFLNGDLSVFDTGDPRRRVTFSRDEEAGLLKLLLARFAIWKSTDDSADDALASLDQELRWHPMGEPHAIVPGVPVAVRTGGVKP